MIGPRRIKDMPVAERPRERLLSRGAENLSATELIAILLRTGSRGRSALELAAELVTRYERLDSLARASVEEIRQVKGIGRDKAAALKAAFTLARQMAGETRDAPPLLDTPDRVAEMLREENRMYSVECFQLVLLNTRRRLIRVERLSQGTLDTLLVHPREVFRAAIVAGAAAIVMVHNHPSGDPKPSAADIAITREIIAAADAVSVRVHDHLVIGRGGAVSMKSLGLL